MLNSKECDLNSGLKLAWLFFLLNDESAKALRTKLRKFIDLAIKKSSEYTEKLENLFIYFDSHSASQQTIKAEQLELSMGNWKFKLLKQTSWDSRNTMRKKKSGIGLTSRTWTRYKTLSPVFFLVEKLVELN